MRTVLCLNPSGILIKKGSCHLFASFLHASGVRSTSERSQYAGASDWIRPSCTHLQAGALSLFEGLLDCVFHSRSQIRYTAVKWQSALLWGAKTLNYTVRLEYNISSAVTQAPYIRLYKQTVFVYNNAQKLELPRDNLYHITRSEVLFMSQVFWDVTRCRLWIFVDVPKNHSALVNQTLGSSLAVFSPVFRHCLVA
jgi:hypothetical protein